MDLLSQRPTVSAIVKSNSNKSNQLVGRKKTTSIIIEIKERFDYNNFYLRH